MLTQFGVTRDQGAEGELVEASHIEEFDADPMFTVDQRTMADFGVQHDAVGATGWTQLDDDPTHGIGQFVDEEQTRSLRRDVDDATAKPQRWSLDAIEGVQLNGMPFGKRARVYEVGLGSRRRSMCRGCRHFTVIGGRLIPLARMWPTSRPDPDRDTFTELVGPIRVGPRVAIATPVPREGNRGRSARLFPRVCHQPARRTAEPRVRERVPLATGGAGARASGTLAHKGI